MSVRYHFQREVADFYDRAEIRKMYRVMGTPGGDTGVVLYRRMLLLTINSNGIIRYQGIEDTIEEEIALELDRDAEEVQKTCDFLRKVHLLEDLPDCSIYFPYSQEIIGRSDEAQRKAEERERKRSEKLTVEARENSGAVPPMSENVQDCPEMSESVRTDLDMSQCVRQRREKKRRSDESIGEQEESTHRKEETPPIPPKGGSVELFKGMVPDRWPIRAVQCLRSWVEASNRDFTEEEMQEVITSADEILHDNEGGTRKLVQMVYEAVGNNDFSLDWLSL